MSRRRRILFVGEASFLSSGYGTYAHELLHRLYDTNRYDIAELGCFAHQKDENKVPWKFYGNLPNGAAEQAIYESNKMLNPFGAWKFEEVCLDWQADAVLTISDPWTLSFLEVSPFRPFFHLIQSPPVDSAPQNDQWISSFTNSDKIITYTDWAYSVLKKQGGNLINLVGTASPGVDLETFRPRNIAKPGFLPADAIIIGTVMRNQKRKLFPDLLRSFRKILDELPRGIAVRLYLYMHTSYPDWWNLPSLMMEHGISHKCLFSYKCKSCDSMFPSFYRDARTVCLHCKQPTAFLPNTHLGVSRENLSQIYNMFDCYVQYANSGGLEMPLVEAAACGIPIFSIDYAGPSDVLTKVKGTPLKYLKLQRDSDVDSDRAIPDNSDFVAKIIKFLQEPESWKKKKSEDARRGVEKHYTWDLNFKVWEKAIESLPLQNRSQTWESSVKLHKAAALSESPQGLPPAALVEWAMVHIAGRPDLCNHFMVNRLLKDLQWGSKAESIGDIHFNELSALGIKGSRQNFTVEDAVEELRGMCEFKNHWEALRAKKMRGLNVR